MLTLWLYLLYCNWSIVCDHWITIITFIILILSIGGIRLLLVIFISQQPEQHPLFSSSPFPQNDTPCTLFTDGAARGNPGEAGAGAVLIGSDGNELGSRSLYLGECTNNVAEYQALIAGLELAEQSGCRVLEIRLDSELIVQQIKGEYKVKNAHLKPLFQKVCSYLAKLENWDIGHRKAAHSRRDLVQRFRTSCCQILAKHIWRQVRSILSTLCC